MLLATKATAAYHKASTNHIQQMRDGMAHVLVEATTTQVREAIEREPDHDVFTLSMDCTTESIKVGNVIGPHQVFLVLGTHVARKGIFLEETDLLCPTQSLAEENAENILAGVRKVVPWLLDRPPQTRALIVNSDSHKANKRFFRHCAALAEQWPELLVKHSFCLMHMICAALVSTLNAFDVINGAFCATLQLHKGLTMANLQQQVHSYIEESLEVVHEWDPSWAGARRKNEAVVDLFMSQKHDPDNCDDIDALDSTQKRRRAAFGLLLDFFPGLWYDIPGCKAGRLVHFCPYGCCTCREISVEKIKACYDDAILSWRPKVPAMNRWTRMWQPLGWWAIGFYMHGLIPAAFAHVQPKEGESFQISLQDLFCSGENNDKSYQARERSRWKKATAWMATPHLLQRLLLILTVMTPPMTLMSDTFKIEKSGWSAVEFAGWLSSPISRCIERYWGMLKDEDQPIWRAFVTDWDETTYAMAFRAVMSTSGDLWLRCIKPFQNWAWKLSLLVNPKVSDAQKDVVAEQFGELDRSVCTNCLDSHFSWKIHELHKNGVSLRGTEMRRLLKDIYKNCPCNNIPVETRFGRQRNYNAANRGRDCSISTVASKHVLAEARWQHAQSCRRSRAAELYFCFCC